MTDGQYVLASEDATLSVGDHTISLASPERNLFSVAFSSALYGAKGNKIMVVPVSRGPALVLELTQESHVAAVCAALRQAGFHVEGAPEGGDRCVPNSGQQHIIDQPRPDLEDMLDISYPLHGPLQRSAG